MRCDQERRKILNLAEWSLWCEASSIRRLFIQYLSIMLCQGSVASGYEATDWILRASELTTLSRTPDKKDRSWTIMGQISIAFKMCRPETKTYREWTPCVFISDWIFFQNLQDLHKMLRIPWVNFLSLRERGHWYPICVDTWRDRRKCFLKLMMYSLYSRDLVDVRHRDMPTTERKEEYDYSFCSILPPLSLRMKWIIQTRQMKRISPTKELQRSVTNSSCMSPKARWSWQGSLLCWWMGSCSDLNHVISTL